MQDFHPYSKMHIMKNIIFSLILMLSLYANAQISDDYFTVSSSTSQSWGGGAAGSGSGTNYTFNITFLQDVQIRFDTAWITNLSAVSISNYSASSQNTIVSFKKNESFILYAKIYNPGERDYYIDDHVTETPESSLPPVNYKGYALIRFYINNKIYYCAVNEMQVLATIAYP